MKKRKINQQDILDPHEAITPDVKYTYKFKGIHLLELILRISDLDGTYDIITILKKNYYIL